MRPSPTTCVALALAFGMAVSAHAGPLATAPVPWLAAAAAVALWRRAVDTRTAVAVAALVGGALAAADAGARARAAVQPMARAHAGDRADDRVRGEVAGLVEDRLGVRWFALHTGGPVVHVAAADAPPVAPGDRVRVVGRLDRPRHYRIPGAPDPARLAAARGVELTMWARSGGVVIERRGAWWRRAPVVVQRRLAGRVTARAGGPDAGAPDDRGAGIVRAMAFGDRGGLDRATSDRFRAAGLSHVLAVSGLHLAATALLCFVAVRRLWSAVPALARRADAYRVAALVAAPVAIGYTLATGARASTTRALVVVLVVLAGAAVRRRPRLLDSLAVAAIAMLVVSPASLWDPGLQLSFAAAVALALRPRRASGGRVAELARASLWVNVALAPVIAALFGELPVAGPLANVVVVPLAELVVLPCALAGAAVAELWPAAGGALLDLAIAAAGACDGLAGRFAQLPVVRVAPPSALEWCAAGVALAAALVAAHRRWRAPRAVAVALVGAGVVVASQLWAGALAARARDALSITFLDVGHGDAAVVELPGGGAWLIDAGGRPFTQPRPGEPAGERAWRAEGPGRAVADYLAYRRIDTVDLVVISHPHPDHYVGLRAIAERVAVREIWTAAPHAEQWSPPFERALAELRVRGAVVRHPPVGHARTRGGATLDVLWPGPRVDPVYSVNDNSLVVAIQFGGRTALFTGDLEAEGEQLLADRGARADIVKVAHHGSATSSTPAFIAATAARWAVISCGHANRFGFPAPDVVARWQAAGARVWRTDHHGSIRATIHPDGAIRWAHW